VFVIDSLENAGSRAALGRNEKALGLAKSKLNDWREVQRAGEE
jgi:hypothetical protein